MGFLDFIAKPMGQFLNFIYNNMAFHSYGMAIIIFTLFIRGVMLPLYIKQYRSTSKMQQIQPLIQEIQKRYKNDKEKLNQEMMKVYQENKVNPAGGCLPLLIQMPILFSLYYVISQPLYYMLGKSHDVINKLFETVPVTGRISTFRDINIINYFTTHQDKLASVGGMLEKDDLLNMRFLGINLGLQPTYQQDKLTGDPQYLLLLLIPVLAAVTTYLSVKLSTPPPATQSATGGNMQNSMTKTMTKVMPLMTAFFSFSVPAGMGFYWIIGNIVQVFQQIFMNKYIIKKKEDVAKIAEGKSVAIDDKENVKELPKGNIKGTSDKKPGTAKKKPNTGKNKNTKKRR